MRLVRFNNYPGYMSNFKMVANQNSFTPEYRVTEAENGNNVFLSVPGYQKDDFQIKVEKNVLIISAEIEKEENSNDWKHQFRKSFEKRFRLGEKMDSDKISASYNNGLLEINVPLKEEEAVVSKRIEIA